MLVKAVLLLSLLCLSGSHADPRGLRRRRLPSLEQDDGFASSNRKKSNKPDHEARGNGSIQQLSFHFISNSAKSHLEIRNAACRSSETSLSGQM